MNGYFKINTNDYIYRKRLTRGDIRDGVVTNAEPTIAWATGKSIRELEEYCKSRGWRIEVELTSFA